jgi:hypothetical protein
LAENTIANSGKKTSLRRMETILIRPWAICSWHELTRPSLLFSHVAVNAGTGSVLI